MPTNQSPGQSSGQPSNKQSREPTGQNHRVALLQMRATADVAANLAQLDRLAEQAHKAGAATLLVPEAFAFIGPDAQKRQMTERLPEGGPILAHCQALATKLGCHLLLGGFHEKLPTTANNGQPDRTKSANTTVHVNPEGQVAARYRKLHLFDVALDDGTVLQESANTAAGSEVVITRLPFGALGLTICYDLRFPALYQLLRAQGAMAIAVPSAFTATTGAAHWHTLLRARAIETQCYILAAAQYGQHNETRRSYGHSLVIDPWGEIIAEGSGDSEGVIVADIDPTRVANVRRQLPSFTHRQPLPEIPAADKTSTTNSQ